MANAYWLDDFATLDLETGGGDSTPVAGIQEVAIEAEYGTLERLYTADSTKVEAQKQAEVSVPVEIGYSKFDPAFVEEWLGGDGSTANSLSDTSDPQEYELTGEFVSEDGSQQLNITVTGITFESIPLLAASRGEFVQWDLSGTGTDITDFEEVATS